MSLRRTLKELERLRDRLSDPRLDPWERTALRVKEQRLAEQAMLEADSPQDPDLDRTPRMRVPAPPVPVRNPRLR